MTEANKKESNLLLGIAGVLTLLVFGLDLIIPLGYTISLAYLAVLILFLRIKNVRYVILFCVAATVLTVLGFFLAPSGEVSIAIFNRAMMIVGLWFTAFFVAQYIRNESVNLKNQDQLNALYQSATEAIIVTDSSGTITMANPRSHELFGYGPDELEGQKIEMLVPDRYQKMHAHLRKNFYGDPHARSMGIGRDLHAKRRNGTEFPVEISLSFFRQKNDLYVISFIIDITRRKAAESAMMQAKALAIEVDERKRTEEALRESQTFLMTLARNFPGGTISAIDRDWNYEFIEGQELRAKRISGEELVGRNLRSQLTPEEYEIIKQPIDKAFNGERSQVEISSGDKHYIYYAEPLADARDEISRVMLVSQDITERKKAEEEVRNALQKERQLNELKSRFVSMASHEFRTPLATVLSSVALIGKYNRPGDDEKREKHINRIKSSVSNLTEILNEFLSLGRLEEGRIPNAPDWFNIQEFSEELREELQMTAKPGQEITYRHYGVGDEVRLDKQLLRNVLINLLSNAIKYSPEEAPIGFETSLKEDELEVNVTDKGIGIPEEDQKFIFSTFFRAHNVTNTQGTGLGLNIVKKYLDLMGGDISFVSEQNKGTTFTVKIPRSYEEDTVDRRQP